MYSKLPVIPILLFSILVLSIHLFPIFLFPNLLFSLLPHLLPSTSLRLPCLPPRVWCSMASVFICMCGGRGGGLWPGRGWVKGHGGHMSPGQREVPNHWVTLAAAPASTLHSGIHTR